MKPLRLGVIGVGHLGARHAEIYAGMPGVELAAVCDVDPKRTRPITQRFGCQAVTEIKHLLNLVDAASVAVPTSLHAAAALPLLKQGIHVLIEKPIASTLAEANRLIRAARASRCILQIGHVERFNAAIKAAHGLLKQPRFLEVHRLSPYPFRGTDVSVILDVMVHDLDMLLWLVGAAVERVEAIGVSVLSRSEDIANARLTFANGCVANLTASRISDEPIRRIRIFQDASYCAIDYKAQTVSLARKRRGNIERVALPVSQRPPLQDELAAFARAIRLGAAPVVSGEDGRAALSLALRIEQAMRRGPARRPRR